MDSLGAAQGAFDRALDYVKQRAQFGKKIVQFQVTQHKLADMVTKIEQTRYLTYNAASRFDNGKDDLRIAAMAKLVASRTAVEVTSEAIHLMGDYGYMKEYEVERFYRNAKSAELISGDPGYLKNTIARSVIGKVR